jgi:putative sporulation protein YtxC
VYAVSIGTMKYVDVLADYLEESLDKLRERGGSVIKGFHVRGKFPYLTYRIEKVEREDETVPLFLAQSLTRFLTEVWERDLLQHIIEKEYDYYTADEVAFLADRGIQFLRNHPRDGKEILRNQELEACIADYLIHNRTFLVEGFVRFRLREFEKDRYRAIEQAIDEYLMDQEYREFIQLIRYFLDMQTSCLPLIHLLYGQKGVLFIDSDGNPIREFEWQSYSLGNWEHELHFDDLVISSLIQLAPLKVRVHSKQGVRLPLIVDTVFDIFENRAQLCPGCTLCHADEEVDFESFPLTFPE